MARNIEQRASAGHYRLGLAWMGQSLPCTLQTQTTNAINQLATTTNPMGYQTTNSYNAAGLLTATTDGNSRTIDYGYNAIGQETSETWVGGNYTATYQYNAAGLLTSASDPYSTYTYSYDADNHETSVSNAGTPGVPTVTLSYGYDTFGNRTSLTDSLGGSISYTFDAVKNLTGLSLSLNGSLTAQVTMGYDAANRLTGLTRTAPSVFGDAIATSFGYDNANELTNITHTDATQFLTLANYTYGYNAGGQLTSYQDNNNSSLTYGYDTNGELTSASGTLNGSTYGVSYSYDANGNRIMTGYVTGTGNELTSDGTYNYTYDNVGNMTAQTNIATGYVTYYSWDYRNRLTEVKSEDNHGNVLNDEKFTYDVNNNRIAVTLNGTTQLYTVYDGANPYMDFNGSGTLTQRYLTNPNGLNQFYGQVSANGTTQWFLTDNINSIRQVIDTSGSSLDAITYDPYGNILGQTNAANAPRMGSAGGAVDLITGNEQFDRRYYSPADGRWLSQDPLSFKAEDLNLYRYVYNSPLNSFDPSGLATVWIGSRPIEESSLSEYTAWTGLVLHWFVVVQNEDGTYTTYDYTIGHWVQNKEINKGYTGFYWYLVAKPWIVYEIPAPLVYQAYLNRKQLDEGQWEFFAYNCRDAAQQLISDAVNLSSPQPPANSWNDPNSWYYKEPNPNDILGSDW